MVYSLAKVLYLASVMNVTHDRLKIRVIRRFFGFLAGTRPNNLPLGTLAQYVGFEDYNALTRDTILNGDWTAWKRAQHFCS